MKNSTLLRTQGVTAPAGFRAAGIAAGIKKSGAPDLAPVFNEGPDYGAAGVFTRNQVKAAPVLWTSQALTTGRLRAVLLNPAARMPAPAAGFSGHPRDRRSGRRDAVELGHRTGPIEVAVCSTGLIGDRLPMDRLLAGVTEIVHEIHAGLLGGDEAARAIMTTDTLPKQVALHHWMESGENWTVGGMAKGAGMMAPSLATMLVVLTTDAVAEAPRSTPRWPRGGPHLRPARCRRQLPTNDTVLLLASGASEIRPTQDQLDDAVFRSATTCAPRCPTPRASPSASRSPVWAPSEAGAIAARLVGRDSLVKTAMFGSDPNWGRVLAAVGMVPFTLDANRISVSFNGSPVCVDGAGAPGARDVDLSGPDIHVVIDLNLGDGEATIRTTDLSHAYVEENSAYSS